MEKALDTLIPCVARYDQDVSRLLLNVRIAESGYNIEDVTTILHAFAEKCPQIIEDESYENCLPGFYLAEAMLINCRTEKENYLNQYAAFTKKPICAFMLQLARHTIKYC